MSSAYSSKLTVPSDVSTPTFSFLISVARSLRKTGKRVVDRLSPCFTPNDVGNQFVNRHVMNEMYCHDLEVMSSNPSRVELEVRSTSVPSRS